MEIRVAQAAVDEWISQYEEGYWSPLANLARLTEEVGELAREVNHRFGDKQKRRDERPSEIADELGDIFWVIVCLANSLQIDLDDAFKCTLAKVTTRDANRFTPKGS